MFFFLFPFFLSSLSFFSFFPLLFVGRWLMLGFVVELHFWPALIMDAIKALAWISELGAYPRLKAFIPYIVPKKAMAARVRHWQYANDKITKSRIPPSRTSDLP